MSEQKDRRTGWLVALGVGDKVVVQHSGGWRPDWYSTGVVVKVTASGQMKVAESYLGRGVKPSVYHPNGQLVAGGVRDRLVTADDAGYVTWVAHRRMSEAQTAIRTSVADCTDIHVLEQVLKMLRDAP